MSRGRIKPAIGPSLIGMIVGVLFVILGITVFIPLANAAGFPASIFAIIWTVIAATITLYYGINFSVAVVLQSTILTSKRSRQAQPPRRTSTRSCAS